MKNITCSNKQCKSSQELIYYYEKKVVQMCDYFTIFIFATIIIALICISQILLITELYRKSTFDLSGNIIESIASMEQKPELIPLTQIKIDASIMLFTSTLEPLRNLYILIFSILGAGMMTITLNLYKAKNEYEEKLVIEKAKGIKLKVK